MNILLPQNYDSSMSQVPNSKMTMDDNSSNNNNCNTSTSGSDNNANNINELFYSPNSGFMPYFGNQKQQMLYQQQQQQQHQQQQFVPLSSQLINPMPVNLLAAQLAIFDSVTPYLSQSFNAAAAE
eukprot:Pgem_evm1s10420